MSLADLAGMGYGYGGRLRPRRDDPKALTGASPPVDVVTCDQCAQAYDDDDHERPRGRKPCKPCRREARR